MCPFSEGYLKTRDTELQRSHPLEPFPGDRDEPAKALVSPLLSGGPMGWRGDTYSVYLGL